MIKDNGGSRSGAERRQFDCNESIPERRSGKDRRKGFDRRSEFGQKRRHQNPDNLHPVERRDQFRRTIHSVILNCIVPFESLILKLPLRVHEKIYSQI